MTVSMSGRMGGAYVELSDGQTWLAGGKTRRHRGRGGKAQTARCSDVLVHRIPSCLTSPSARRLGASVFTRDGRDEDWSNGRRSKWFMQKIHGDRHLRRISRDCVPPSLAPGQNNVLAATARLLICITHHPAPLPCLYILDQKKREPRNVDELDLYL